VRKNILLTAVAVALLVALIAVPGSSRRIKSVTQNQIASEIQGTLLADETEAYAWARGDGTCLLICKTSITTLVLSSYSTAAERALAILKEVYRLAPHVVTLYYYSEEEDELTIELTRHTRKQVYGCLCDEKTGACCQGSATVIEQESLTLGDLGKCQALARGLLDRVVIYVQAAPSAWGFDDIIRSYAAFSADWGDVLQYTTAGASGGADAPTDPCDRQVTVVVAEVEECEGEDDYACYAVQATHESLSSLLERLCATRVVLILIESDGSLLGRASLVPSLGGVFDALYVVPVDGRTEQAQAFATLLLSQRPSAGMGTNWLLAQLRALGFQAVFRLGASQ